MQPAKVICIITKEEGKCHYSSAIFETVTMKAHPSKFVSILLSFSEKIPLI